MELLALLAYIYLFEKIVQLVRCLLCDCVNLKTQVGIFRAYVRGAPGVYPQTGRGGRGWRQEDPWDLLVSQVSQPVSSRFTERPCFRK